MTIKMTINKETGLGKPGRRCSDWSKHAAQSFERNNGTTEQRESTERHDWSLSTLRPSPSHRPVDWTRLEQGPKTTTTATVTDRMLLTRATMRSAMRRHGALRIPSVMYSSHSPPGSASLGSRRKKVTLNVIRDMYDAKEPITVMTAHDFPSAHVADAAGMDIILVGDSLAMVALGMEDTSELELDEMILHCRSVARATRAAFTVGRLMRLFPLVGGTVRYTSADPDEKRE